MRRKAVAIRADHARVIALCERLADATLAGATEWQDAGNDHFTWARTEGRVSIGARDRDGQPPYEIAIFNPGGDKVEELASALADDESPADWNAPIAELYRVARRNALRADEIIDALMSALPTPPARPAAAERATPDQVPSPSA
jgi:ankyrin repeat protein